jgi:PTS system N-acetylglucosamine-specific IIC component
MYHTALADRRKAVAGMLLSLALTSFLTGVTEPIEFSFLFLAPALYVLHAILTGASMVIMNVLGVKLGFGFSAGLFDYVLSFGIATRPLLLIPVGLAYFAIYYFSFSWGIRRFDLKTPGRDAGEVIAPRDVSVGTRGGDFALALGGSANLKSVNACMTRLRLTLNDPDAIDEPRLRALGARGFVRPGGDALQVVLGPIADQVAGEIRASLRDAPAAPAAQTAAAGPEWTAALGGEANVEDVQQRSERLILRLGDADKLDEPALKRLGARAVVRSAGGRLHLLVDETTAASLRQQFQPA